jgi:hypothetical protein
MARDWDAVAGAMQARIAELDMTQTELVQRSRLAPMTIRELLFNTAPRRRSDRTLGAVSVALGWPEEHLRAVAEGLSPADSVAGSAARIALVEEGIAAMREKADGQDELLADVVREVQEHGRLLARISQRLERAGITLADPDRRDEQAV